MDTVDVSTTAGVVRGRQRSGSAAFLGIPYAAPPVGELRFAAPVPHPGLGRRAEMPASPGATPQRDRRAATPPWCPSPASPASPR